jgi:NitT/TauT family transport system permease protein/sulfonate transport system permease protein
MKQRVSREALFWAMAGLVLLLVVWQLIATATAEKGILPPPLTVFIAFVKALVVPIGKFTVFQHVAFSLYRVFFGYCIAAVTGIALGLTMGWSRVVEALVKPLFELLRPIPPLAWIPMGILWFGIGETTKYFIIFIATFMTITLNAYRGAQKVDPVLIGAARMLGASQRQVFFAIVLPSSIPQIFAGLQVALSSGWMAVLAAEMVRSSEGAGWIIIRGMEIGDTTQIIVGMISIGIVGFALATLMRWLEGRLCSWNVQGS